MQEVAEAEKKVRDEKVKENIAVLKVLYFSGL